MKQEKAAYGASGAGAALSFAHSTFSPSSSATADLNTVGCKVKPWREIFRRRPVGLNDGNELALTVYSIDIRPLFVYIYTRYRTYSQTFRNVAINLSDWRGPPDMFEV